MPKLMLGSGFVWGDGTPLYELLEWILEQLNCGNAVAETGEDGNVHTLVLGLEASRDWSSSDEAESHFQHRSFVVTIARALAEAREAGVEPKHADLVNRVTSEGTRGGDFATPSSLMRLT